MTIADVVQESGSPANPGLLELQERAREMARYYYKGLGTKLSGLMVAMEYHFANQETNGVSELRRESDGIMGKIADFYGRIPFLELAGRSDFAPLFVANSLISNLKETLGVFYRENDQSSLAKITRLVPSIIEVGWLYRDSLNEILKEIQKHEEGRLFRIELIDIDGKLWRRDII